MSCNSKTDFQKSIFTGAVGEVKLAVVAPAHFHASLLQKSKIAQLNDTVHVFAPEGHELEQYLADIKSYNERKDDPTNWSQKVYKNEDFLDNFAKNKDVNVVVSGRKQ